MSKNTIESTGNETKPKFVARTLTDVQRIKLQKLMDNPVSGQYLNYLIICFVHFNNSILKFMRTEQRSEHSNCSD